MSKYESHDFTIPNETAEVAQAVFPKGNVYMTLRDELGPLFKDSDFMMLFTQRGQAGVSPGLLAMVTVMQFMEGMTDRQTAKAVRSRIDWKYALGLPLRYTGFHFSILSAFRERLLEGGRQPCCLTKCWHNCRSGGWSRAGDNNVLIRHTYWQQYAI